MKRLVLFTTCLAFAATAFAQKPRAPQRAAPLAPATVTITGSPLTIVVGDDTSMQVYNSNVPGTGQFYPPDCAAGQTANSGIFVGLPGSGGSIVFGPDFANHPCDGAVPTFTPFTPVSLSAVTGTGTSSDPFTVVIVVDVEAVLRMTETLTYVNGSGTANIALSFAAPPPPAAPAGGVAFNVFIGADLFLADSDAGFSFGSPSAAGGHGASSACQQLQYTISFLGVTPANAYTAQGYGSVWSEVLAGTLDNAIDPTCIDNGAALEWNMNFGGTPVTINTGVSFTGQAVPVSAAVPALSTVGLAALIAILAAVGYILARKASSGA
jgi:hypothetical protein